MIETDTREPTRATSAYQTSGKGLEKHAKRLERRKNPVETSGGNKT